MIHVSFTRSIFKTKLRNITDTMRKIKHRIAITHEIASDNDDKAKESEVNIQCKIIFQENFLTV